MPTTTEPTPSTVGSSVKLNATRDPDRSFTHTITVFSVSAGMIGVCLTAIGLVQLVVKGRSTATICDDLLVLDAAIFGVACLICYLVMQGYLHNKFSPLEDWVDRVFLLGLALMVFVCGIFAWSIF